MGYVTIGPIESPVLITILPRTSASSFLGRFFLSSPLMHYYDVFFLTLIMLLSLFPKLLQHTQGFNDDKSTRVP